MKRALPLGLLLLCACGPDALPAYDYVDSPCELWGEWQLDHALLGAECTPPTWLVIDLDDDGCDVDSLGDFPAPFDATPDTRAPRRCPTAKSHCGASMSFSAAHFDPTYGATERIELHLDLRQLSDGRLAGTTTMSLTGCNGEATQTFTTFATYAN